MFQNAFFFFFRQSGLPVIVAVEYSPTYTQCLTLKAAQDLQILHSDLGRRAHTPWLQFT